MNLSPLLRTFCRFIISVLKTEQSGTGKYSMTGISNVLISVVCSFGVRFLNLVRLVTIAFSFYILFETCSARPVDCNLRPENFPSLLEFMFSPFAVICCVLYCAIGITLIFPSLVYIFHFISNLLVLFISLSNFSFMCFDSLVVVSICVMSSAYRVSVQPGHLVVGHLLKVCKVWVIIHCLRCT